MTIWQNQASEITHANILRTEKCLVSRIFTHSDFTLRLSLKNTLTRIEIKWWIAPVVHTFL